jgi:hypothetical protein
MVGASRWIGKAVSSILINGSGFLKNSVVIVQECDATSDAQSGEDGLIKIPLHQKEF